MDKRLQEIKAGLGETFKINQFLQLTDFLTELITKEMGYLKSVNLQEVEKTQPLKHEACSMYVEMIRHLKENTEILDSLAVQERRLLKDVTENLSRLLDRNELMIKSFNEANKRVMEIFHEVVQSRISTNYGPEGKRRPPISGFSNFSQNG
jgi:hypothetical protein